MGRELSVSLMFPSSSSIIRRLASLHRIPRDRFSGFVGTIKALRLPIVLPAPLAFVRRAVPRTAARHEAAGSCCWPAPHRYCPPVPRSSAFGSHSWRRPDLPGSSATLSRTCPALRPRRTSPIRPLRWLEILPSAQLTASAPHSVTFRGSITQPVRSLSTLRSSDYSDRTPRKTRFPLAANLGGAGLSPAGLLKEVSTLCFNSHRFLLLEAFLAHQPT